MAHLLNRLVQFLDVKPGPPCEEAYGIGNVARLFGIGWYGARRWRRIGLLPRSATRQDIERLAASLRPSALGKASLARIERAKQRDLDRANAASVLLKAETAKRPQRNYSMAQAALARIAAGAEPCELPPDKRRRKRKP